MNFWENTETHKIQSTQISVKTGARDRPISFLQLIEKPFPLAVAG